MIIIIMMIMTAFTKLTLEDANHTWQFNYSLANFGHIPYGHTITGYLELPIEIENKQYDLCNKSNLNKTQSQNNHWIVGQRGNCTFTTKAINAQLLGAQLLIIVDNTTEQSESLLMIDDGYGFQVYIPTLIVNKADGQSLITDLQENIKIHGIMSFNDSLQVENPNIILGLSFTNRESFRFLREFQSYYLQLNNSCTFEIAYQMYSCSACQKQNYSISQKDCLGGGRYCQDKPDQYSSGQDVLKEQLRQLCLFQVNQSEWFKYLNYFDLNCVQPSQFEKCFNDAVPTNLQDSINICYKNSFDGQQSQLDLKTNTLLDQSLQFTQLSGLHFYPGALINYVPFRGNFEADALSEDICSVMTNPAPICTQKDNHSSSNNSLHVGMIIFVLVSFILFALFLFYCYRRRIKQQAQEELGQQVNEMVSQYIKFYETKQQS